MFDIIKNLLFRFIKNYGGVDLDAVQNGDTSSLYSHPNENSFWSTVSNSFKQILQGIPSLINRFTDAHATGGEIERNEMQMQNVEDTYQRQVTGMQNAGINPALMYQSGAGQSAPSVSTSGSGAGMSMSDLMSMMLLPEQKALMRAQASNLMSSAKKNDKQTEKIGEEIGLVRSKIENSNLDAKSKSIALKYQDDFARADLAIKNASEDNLRASYKSLMEGIHKMKYEELSHLAGYLETIEKISVMEKQKELSDAQISELGALTDKLNQEKRLIGLQADNFDYINGFVTNYSIGAGPFKGSASKVITLKDLRDGVRIAMEEAKENVHDDKKSWQEQKEEATKKYGVLE